MFHPAPHVALMGSGGKFVLRLYPERSYMKILHMIFAEFTIFGVNRTFFLCNEVLTLAAFRLPEREFGAQSKGELSLLGHENAPCHAPILFLCW